MSRCDASPARLGLKVRNEVANEFIADVLPVRGLIKLQRIVTTFLGKGSLDLERSGFAYCDREIRGRIT